jgi:hypothetical protein
VRSSAIGNFPVPPTFTARSSATWVCMRVMALGGYFSSAVSLSSCKR